MHANYDDDQPETDLDKMTEEMRKLKVDLASARSELNNEKQKNAKLTVECKELKSLEIENERLEERLEEAYEESSKLQKEIDDMIEGMEDRDDIFEDKIQMNNIIWSLREKLEMEREDSEETINELYAKIHELQKQKSCEKFNDNSEKINNLHAIINHRDEKIVELKKHLSGVNRKLREYQQMHN